MADTSTPAPPSALSAKRFRVAFSFAGEKRPFVAEVARLLAERFAEDKVLYDKFHEAEFARNDLSIYLPNLYNRETDLVIVVVCPHYDVKEWTGLEWLAIHDLLQQRRREEVMLCRFEHAQVDGLFRGAGFLELDRKTPEQFATLILERLALNEGLPKDHYTKPAVSPQPTLRISIPNNLPRLQHFFGRENELKTIADALAPNTRSWGALIDGPGGMGKTSLAVRAAELVPPGAFQRIIFLSAKEHELTSDGKRPLAGFVLRGFLAMLNEMAAQLSLPGLAQAPEETRSRWLQHALQDKSVLLILDNLETESFTPDDHNQLYTFLSMLPLGCKAIVISRRRSDIDARTVRLDRLSSEAALALIAELAKSRPHLERANLDQRQDLYAKTGGNPLLIRWVAGNLGRGQYTSVGAALEILRNAPPDNDPLEFIFGDVLKTLTQTETKVLAALTHFIYPIEVKFIAELGDIGLPAAKIALEDLAYRSAVVPDKLSERFVLAPMVADFLRRKHPQAVNTTSAFLVKHAYALIMENGGERYDRFQFLENAWDRVEPALEHFQKGNSERFQRICDGLIHFFNYSGRWDERISICLEAEIKAVQASDLNTAGWRAYQAGGTYYRREQGEQLLLCADRMARYWGVDFDQTPDSEFDKSKRAYALRLRGLARRLKGEYSAAISDFYEALALFGSLPEKRQLESMSLNDIGTAQRYAGDLDSAEASLKKALKLASEIGYVEGIASYTSGLARIEIERHHWDLAERLAQEALILSENLPRKELVAHACRRLATALVRQDRKAEALPLARRAVDLYLALASPNLDSAIQVLAECER